MKIKFLVFSAPKIGFGHWYRSLALANYLVSEGHVIEIISDRQPPLSFRWYKVAYGDTDLWRGHLTGHCDWLIIDLPDEPPDWVYSHCSKRGIKTLVLNGVGHQLGDRATLRIVQGLDDQAKYSGVDYIILRDNVFKAKAARNPVIPWFVFGGAADHLGLTQGFPNWTRTVVSISAIDWQSTDNYDTGFLQAAAGCKKACVSMGMTALELAAFGNMPIYIFSLTALHLKFAKGLETAGYAKAFDRVGLPGGDEMINFLLEPYEITGRPIDGLACQRIGKLMENLAGGS